MGVATRVGFRLDVEAAKLNFDQYLLLNDMYGKALQAGTLWIDALSIRGVELPSVRSAGYKSAIELTFRQRRALMRTVPLIGVEPAVDLEEQDGRIARAEALHLAVPKLVGAANLDGAGMLSFYGSYHFQRTSSHCSGRGDKSFKREAGASVRPPPRTSR